MARAQLNTALTDLAAVVKEMRELGVQAWLASPVGDVHLGPEPIKPPKVDKTEKDPLASRRADYANILGYAPSDEMLKRLP